MSYVVFTGPAKVDGVRVTRDLLKELAHDRGFHVQDAVSHRTSFVVTASHSFKNRKGIKLRKADDYGIPVITVDEFLDLAKI